MLDPFNDQYFMKQAYLEAQKAFDQDEVPVGAVIVCKNQIIARTHNLTEMASEANLYEALWRPYRLVDGYNASEGNYDLECEFEEKQTIKAKINIHHKGLKFKY